jgi:CheY-like chemotaxis protein
MCKVLIVEDETSVREILKQTVERSGLQAKEASNAVEALLLIEKFKSIRIVICDLHLPGMDGLTLCRKMKRLDPLLIILGITGYKTLFNLVECRQSGFDDLIFKPFEVILLKDMLAYHNATIERWQTQT